MRLFIAINFPAEVKATIMQSRDSLKQAALQGNFSLDENLHLTLVFLGECDVRQANIVKAVMDDVRFEAFTLSLDKGGRFKRQGGDTWWIGLKENKTLSDLQADLTRRLIQKGFILDDRKYSPHVTMGREIKLRPGFITPEIPQVSFTIASIELMKSERINGRLTYTQVYSKRADE